MEHIGALVGAAAASSEPPGINPAYHNGRVARLIRDFITVDAAQNDTVVLAAALDWNTVLDETSFINFTDLGTSITMDVGFPNDVDALIDGADVATAAGSVNLMTTVTIANRHKPLWALAGYASKDAAIEAGYATAKILATLLGGNPDAGTLAWTIYGSPQ